MVRVAVKHPNEQNPGATFADCPMGKARRDRELRGVCFLAGGWDTVEKWWTSFGFPESENPEVSQTANN